MSLGAPVLTSNVSQVVVELVNYNIWIIEPAGGGCVLFITPLLSVPRVNRFVLVLFEPTFQRILFPFEQANESHY